MISIDNQYKISFSLDSKKDFISEEDFNALLLVEECGNLLPSYELGFTLSDPSLLPYLNEGSTIKFSFGKDTNSMVDSFLRILKKNFVKDGKHKYIVHLIGLYDALGYITDCKIRDFQDKSGIEVIHEVVDTYFKPVFNVTSSQDKQTWLQPNIPDKKFINNTWMHSYIENSFIGVGITTEGEFILKDIVKEVKLKTKPLNPDWRFVLKQLDFGKDLVFDGDYILSSETGFVNQWVGYGRSKETRIIETAENNVVQVEPAPLIVQTNKLDRALDSGVRTAQFGLLNDNVHADYWKAYYQNLTNLAVFGSTKVGISFQLGMIPPNAGNKRVKILDLIMFKDEDIDLAKGKGNPPTSTKANEYAGLYFITKVGRSITSRGVATTVEINRESVGQLFGEKLK